MIEMDMRQHDVRNVRERDSLADELALEHRQTARRPRVYQCNAAGGLDDGRGNRMRTAEKLKVDIGQT